MMMHARSQEGLGSSASAGAGIASSENAHIEGDENAEDEQGRKQNGSRRKGRRSMSTGDVAAEEAQSVSHGPAPETICDSIRGVVDMVRHPMRSDG
jgi:hypothetical protein